jgi:DNA-binding transcriptional LysR family regulator
VTQAAVSGRIRALENELGIVLFDRQSGGVRLTTEGRKLYGLARKILDLHQEARASLTGRRPPLSGELLVAASSVPGESLLPAFLGTFREKQPGIQVRVAVNDSQQALAAVEVGKAQLGIVGRLPVGPHFEFRPVGEDELVGIVHPGHPSASKGSMPLSRFTKEPLIIREPGSGSRERLVEALRAAGLALADVHVILELGSNEAIKSLVEQGTGMAVLSRMSVSAELARKQLAMVRIPELDLARSFYLVWDRRRVLSPVAQAFVSQLIHPQAEGIS